MKFALISLLFASASAKAPASHELTKDYSFEEYSVDFGKSYSRAEMKNRAVIFEKNKMGKAWLGGGAEGGRGGGEEKGCK